MDAVIPFTPDGGSARADFPGGDGDIKWETSVADERTHNIHVRDGIGEDDFVKMREERDKQLAMPKPIIPSIQINMRGGHLPPKDESGKTFLKVPVNGL